MEKLGRRRKGFGIERIKTQTQGRGIQDLSFWWNVTGHFSSKTFRAGWFTVVGHPLVFWSRCSRVDIRYRVVTYRPHTITFYFRVKILPPILPFVLRSVGVLFEGLDTFRGQWVGRKATRPIGFGSRGAGRGGLFDTSHQVSKMNRWNIIGPQIVQGVVIGLTFKGARVCQLGQQNRQP